MHRKPFLFPLAISAIAPFTPLNSAFAAAEAPHADIFVWAEGAQLRTASWDHGTDQIIDLSARVFSADLGEDPDFPFAIDEPGIGSNLVGTTLNMRLLPSLSRWSGEGLTSCDQFLSLSFGGQSASTSVGGFVSFLVSAGLDLHPDYVLSGAAEADPTDGVYIATFAFAAEGFVESAPLWVVFNLGADEADHDAAIDWVQANLVPAPGALSLLAFMGVGRGRRRSV